MKTFKLLILGSAILILNSCAKIYYSPDSYPLAKRHKLIAIIPPAVSIKVKKNMDMIALKEEQKTESISFQKEMYAWLLKRKTEKKLKPKIQDIELTNIELAKINYPEKQIPLEELCKILGVDAVITSNFNLSHPMSESAALALGYMQHHWGFGSWGWGATNEVYVSMSIYDTKEEKLIWNYGHNCRGALGSTPQRLVDKLMRHASKKMPYIRKKR